MSADARAMDLASKAAAQIRDALCTLSYCSDGHYEGEAQVALDALDWLEANIPTDDRAIHALNLIADNHQGESWSAGVAVSVLASIEDPEPS